jgi:uncharacterized membrane protein YccC
MKLTKNFKFWLVLGLILLLIIAMVVIRFVQPNIPYQWVELFLVISFILGGVTGYFVNDHFTIEKK